jgi:ribosomal protein L7Ae-like RNA K-turn-binding protein
MNLQTNKAKTYLGFAIKSRAVKFGVDDICKCKKVELILVSDSLMESSFNKITKFSMQNNIDLLKIGLEKFEDLLDNKSVKAVAILDKNLALAIKKEFD